ncbi:hypothetical protein AS594_06955 [Streptomyces agglomeratus]|uniref:Uncharacterized protein n=1 Tax=Streptomyces agglomeratus TaxID=285458 RepID=A0A1E5P417_9ACTN|nr:hypothetical protein [Streptomyces agglomeratus]OEJ24262.1 hypothetical protein AS594_06955 [Streptomyces agglomeratus]
MSTPVTPQKKRAWQAKFKRLASAAQKAEQDVLVGIYEARTDGLTQADIAYMLDGLSPSGIRAKATKGEKIAMERKRGKTSP